MRVRNILRLYIELMQRILPTNQYIELVNTKWLIILFVTASSISFISELFAIAFYLYNKQIREFAFKLIFYLNISDAILNFSFILSSNRISTSFSYKADAYCLVQAFLINFGQLASIFWGVIIAYNLGATVLANKQTKQHHIRFLLIGYGIPLTLSLIPFITSSYGDGGIYCWINIFGDSVANQAYTYVMFNAPLWLATIFNIIVCFKVICYIRSLTTNNPQAKAFIKKLYLFPFILVSCWIWRFSTRIVLYFGNIPIWLAAIAAVFAGIYGMILFKRGFLNVMAYGFNERVRKTIIKFLLCKDQQGDQKQKEMTKKQIQISYLRDRSTTHKQPFLYEKPRKNSIA